MRQSAFWSGYDLVKGLIIGGICLWAAWIIGAALMDVSTADKLFAKLTQLENEDYLATVQQLHENGNLTEALELARFVADHPDMPHHEECQDLAIDLDKELNSWGSKAKRATKGFVTGEGQSIEEIGGSITSDMIIYGDIRDLIKQGYYKVTKNDEKTDPVIAGLATAGLVTEAFDWADWGPAVLKGFRKVKALTNKFSDTLIELCKKSAKAKKVDASLKQIFINISTLTDKVGLGRAAGMMKHVDTPDDLAAITKAVTKTPNAYVLVTAGGKDAIAILQPLSSAAIAPDLISTAAKKGNKAIEWLHSDAGSKYLKRLRFASRAGKHIRRGHHKALLADAFKRYDWAKDVGRLAFWGFLIACVVNFLNAIRRAEPIFEKISNLIRKFKKRTVKAASQ